LKGLTVDFIELLEPVSQLQNKELTQYFNDCSNIYMPEEKAIPLVQTLKIKSTKRFAMEQCQKIYTEVKTTDITVEEISQRLSIAAKSVIVRNPDYQIQDIGKLITESINSMALVGNDICPSGIEDLDILIKGGLRRADYCVIGARPSVGKSAMCLDFLLTSAIAGKWSLMFSTEMPKEQIMIRAVAKMSMIPMDKLTGTNGQRMDEQEARRYAVAFNLLQKSKMVVYDDKVSASSIIAEYHRQKAMGNDIRLVVVDYIQQLKLEGKYAKKEEAMSNITTQFLRLAVEEKITVIVVAQLNREADPYQTPQLSQIKDCGTIEQDVTTAIMLNLDKNDPSVTRVSIQKHRNGVNHTSTELKFYGSCMAFRGLGGY
jgi:replicative DNA helicase